jgi:hypothetical protein
MSFLYLSFLAYPALIAGFFFLLRRIAFFSPSKNPRLHQGAVLSLLVGLLSPYYPQYFLSNPRTSFDAALNTFIYLFFSPVWSVNGPLVAIVLAVVALVKINGSKDARTGNLFAVTGLLFGLAGLFPSLIPFVVMFGYKR